MTDVHEHIESLIAAYAVGAVPEDEIPGIRAHILSCEACFEEAESYADALVALAESVDPVPLPRDFAERVMRDARPEPAVRSKRRIRMPSSRQALLVAGVGLTLLLTIVAATSLVGSITREQRYERVVTALVRDPHALVLKGAGGAEGVIASTDRGSMLVALDLGEAPRGRDYQLWLTKDGVPTPDETFDVSDSVVIVESARRLDGYDGAAITVEPEGGSEQPTTEPVLAT
jgi:anti-sigma-K factor RskA